MVDYDSLTVRPQDRRKNRWLKWFTVYESNVGHAGVKAQAGCQQPNGDQTGSGGTNRTYVYDVQSIVGMPATHT